MELEKIKTDATTITATLEEEGIMSLNELKEMTNLEEKRCYWPWTGSTAKNG